MLIRIAVFTLLIPPIFAQPACEKLADFKLSHYVITSAAIAPEANIAPPFPGAPSVTAPARCEVKAVSRPTSDSEIKIEVWLPIKEWNGKYYQVGNGGWAGVVPLTAMVAPLRRGYVVAGTDGGHSGGGLGGAITWAIGHPEKLIDFGYRALSETSVLAKALIRAHYGKGPSHNYFVGCSDGGREALMQAQRFPEDFDGIIAGAPANEWSGLCTSFLWNAHALSQEPQSAIPAAKLAMVQKAVHAACDLLDGVKDGLIENPNACRFDPATLACNGADASDCLTPLQIAALKKIYSGPQNPRTGKSIYPGIPPGFEATWAPWIVNPAGQTLQFGFGISYYRMAVFEDSNWDHRKLDFDADVAFGERKAGSILSATNPDLRSFRAHGGKLIQYHGWGDTAIPAGGSIDYYQSVLAFFERYPDPRSSSKSVKDFYRLFLVPGMAHCAGGVGPASFGNGSGESRDPERDMVSALERWVEKGVPPDRLIGAGITGDDTKTKLTRPLCPYPQIARYNGTGDTNDAANFTCGPAR
jgi:feruloyl esterase